MAKKAKWEGSTVYILWDRVNQLIHGVHTSQEDADQAVADLAGQPGHDYDLHVLEAPGR